MGDQRPETTQGKRHKLVARADEMVERINAWFDNDHSTQMQTVAVVGDSRDTINMLADEVARLSASRPSPDPALARVRALADLWRANPGMARLFGELLAAALDGAATPTKEG